MTLEEVAKKYEISPNSLKTNFNRTRDSILKKHNVRIIKEGRGKNAYYREQILSDNRSETIFKALEPLRNDAGVLRTDLNLPNLTFNVFMGVITTPMFVFRGTYKDLSGYLEIGADEKTLGALKDSINELVKMMILNEIIDKTTEDDVITLSLVRKAEIDMKINMNMLNMCKILAEQNHMKSWIPLLKVWLGLEILSQKDSFLQGELIEMTGLKPGMVTKCTKLLEGCNIFMKSRAYAGFKKCIGSTVDMNNEAFYKELSQSK